MKLRHLVSAALLGFSAAGYAATCTTSNPNLGTLPDDSTAVTLFGAGCTGTGPDGDPGRYYDEYFTFTLDAPVTWLWGHASMPQLRDLDPDSPTRGDMIFALAVNSITLEFDGKLSTIGTDIHNHEVANFYVADLLPGDYVLGFHGFTFGLSGNGRFDAVIGVDYANSVPEPDARWLMLAGLAAIVPLARPKRARVAA